MNCEKNGYYYTKLIFEWMLENQEEANPNIVALALFLVEINNKLGWKDNFSIYPGECMRNIGLKSYNPYIKALNKLVEIGFIKVISKPRNQHQCWIVSLID